METWTNPRHKCLGSSYMETWTNPRHKCLGHIILRSGDTLFEPCGYILKTADAQVNPPPKAATKIKSPLFTRPSARASFSAVGIEAEEVFPYL
ncbi:hypothetical protein BMS3Bbin04_02047 [bacterium BMS3Bbin04]|nr:hypothetical protein BMS3Bbin04_02047 [bacterium BMS3Bbin04]